MTGKILDVRCRQLQRYLSHTVHGLVITSGNVRQVRAVKGCLLLNCIPGCADFGKSIASDEFGRQSQTLTISISSRHNTVTCCMVSRYQFSARTQSQPFPVPMAAPATNMAPAQRTRSCLNCMVVAYGVVGFVLFPFFSVLIYTRAHEFRSDCAGTPNFGHGPQGFWIQIRASRTKCVEG